MNSTSQPLTPEQERALRRRVGGGCHLEIIMMARASHFVRVDGLPAVKFPHTHALPGDRTVRYARSGSTLLVADV